MKEPTEKHSAEDKEAVNKLIARDGVRSIHGRERAGDAVREAHGEYRRACRIAEGSFLDGVGILDVGIEHGTRTDECERERDENARRALGQHGGHVSILAG